MSTEEFQVWVTLALERQDLSILADWLKEQSSATLVAFLEAFHDHFQHHQPILTWSDEALHWEAYWSQDKQLWMFTGDILRQDNLRQVAEWLEFEGAEPFWLIEEGLCLADIAAACHQKKRWVISRLDMSWFTPYEDNMTLTRVGTNEGKVLSGQQAIDWYHSTCGVGETA
jgi:hypothetical protein